MCCREGTRAAKYVREIQATSDHTADDVAKVKRRVVNSTGTKFFTYRTDINPSLDPHPVYTDIRAKVREHHRIDFSRFRLSAHNLAIETGRWSRIPHEERVCECGSVQTEKHVVLECPVTRDIRGQGNISFTSMIDVFSCSDSNTLCHTISKIYSRYK